MHEQCELTALEWRVYGTDSGISSPVPSAATTVSSHVDSIAATAVIPSTATTAHATELHALYTRLQQQQLLTVLECQGDATSAVRVWLLVVNNGSQDDFPPADALGDLIEVDSGAWTREHDDPLPLALQQRLLAALTTRVAHVTPSLLLQDATFVFRCPSRSHVNRMDACLREELSIPTFTLTFALLAPSNVLTATLTTTIVCDPTATAVTSELGNPHASMLRLLQLPTTRDHSMVDVWHSHDHVLARLIAGTTYSNQFPRFQTLRKRPSRTSSDINDANATDDTSNTSATDDATDGNTNSATNASATNAIDDDDDEQDDEQDEHEHGGRVDGDDSATTNNKKKRKKRKKLLRDAIETDDASIVPSSPDPHVNSPDGASHAIVCVAFPIDASDRMETLKVDADVHFYKRRRHAATMMMTQSTAERTLTWSNSNSNSDTQYKQNDALALRRSAASLTTGASSATRAVEGTALALSQLMRSTTDKQLRSVALSQSHDAQPLQLPHDDKDDDLTTLTTKDHPLLQALATSVAIELQADAAMQSARVSLPKQRVLATAPAFVPSTAKQPLGLQSTTFEATERLRNRLLTDRFAPWRIAYAPHTRLKKRASKQRKRDQQQRLMRLSNDDDALVAYATQHAAALITQSFAIRDAEIALGIHFAASDALVTWRLAACGSTRWRPAPSTGGVRMATIHEQQDVVDRVQPHLQSLRTFLTRGTSDSNRNNLLTHRPSPWLLLDEVAALRSRDCLPLTTSSAKQPTAPQLCVATADYNVHVPSTVLSEYLLRGFHPVAAPKPVDFVVVCPHSPTEWLATLALSFVTSVKSLYTQCHMGDYVAIDLTALTPTPRVSVDATNATLLVACADDAADAFGPYRAAGRLLQPLLQSGVKKTQAFARSAVANVVFVVVPCRRADVKHRTWATGAIASGLFGDVAVDGEKEDGESNWRDSVTIELVFLDDLVAVSVTPTPFALLPLVFGLFDRIGERVALKLADCSSDTSDNSGGRTRVVRERLFHLAERPAVDVKDSDVTHIYASYAVSDDRKWVASSCVDAVGSVLETRMLRVRGDSKDDALDDVVAQLLGTWLEFLALFGERATLVIARLRDDLEDTGDADDLRSASFEAELRSWRRLTMRPTPLVTPALAPLVARIALVVVRVVPPTELQLRAPNASMLGVFGAARSSRVAFIATSLHERGGAQLGSRRACFARNGGNSVATTDTDTAVVLRVTVTLDNVAASSSSSGDDNDEKTCDGAVDVERIANDFYALSYLTMHPITTERASPLPVHLAAVDTLTQDLRLLALQLRTDPLETR